MAVLQEEEGFCYQTEGSGSGVGWGRKKIPPQVPEVLSPPWGHSGWLSRACLNFPLPPLQGLDWAALAARKIPAPFQPQIRSELDVGNFAEEFTRLEPVYSPPGSPPPGDPRIFQVSEYSWNSDAGWGCLSAPTGRGHCTGSVSLRPASTPDPSPRERELSVSEAAMVWRVRWLMACL